MKLALLALAIFTTTACTEEPREEQRQTVVQDEIGDEDGFNAGTDEHENEEDTFE